MYETSFLKFKLQPLLPTTMEGTLSQACLSCLVCVKDKPNMHIGILVKFHWNYHGARALSTKSLLTISKSPLKVLYIMLNSLPKNFNNDQYLTTFIGKLIPAMGIYNISLTVGGSYTLASGPTNVWDPLAVRDVAYTCRMVYFLHLLLRHCLSTNKFYNNLSLSLCLCVDQHLHIQPK